MINGFSNRGTDPAPFSTSREEYDVDDDGDDDGNDGDGDGGGGDGDDDGNDDNGGDDNHGNMILKTKRETDPALFTYFFALMTMMTTDDLCYRVSHQMLAQYSILGAGNMRAMITEISMCSMRHWTYLEGDFPLGPFQC